MQTHLTRLPSRTNMPRLNRKHHGLGCSICITVALLIPFLCGSIALAGMSGKPTPISAAEQRGFKPSVDDLKKLTPVMLAADRFKSTARVDFEKALLIFTRDLGREKMWALNAGWGPPALSQWTWMHFLGAAVQVMGGRQGDFGLVGYYNPYCDAFLITAWDQRSDIPQIVDAEMLMGDWVRNDNDILDPTPLWLREEIHRPLALGLSVAESLISFERMLDGATPNDWRMKLPILQSEEALQYLNYPGLALMLNQHLSGIDALLDADAEDPALAACRQLAGRVLAEAAAGRIATSLSTATDTLPDTKTALLGTPPEWFKDLKMTAARTGPDGALIFFSPARRTTSSLGLYFSGTPKHYTLRRVDLVDYQAFYNRLKYYQYETAKGGRP